MPDQEFQPGPFDNVTILNAFAGSGRLDKKGNSADDDFSVTGGGTGGLGFLFFEPGDERFEVLGFPNAMEPDGNSAVIAAALKLLRVDFAFDKFFEVQRLRIGLRFGPVLG